MWFHPASVHDRRERLQLCDIQRQIVSQSNQRFLLHLVEVSDGVFMVHVCTVIGCTDPVVPRGANMTRTGDKAVITCRSTAQTWHIVCQGSVWYGKVDNCTTSNQPLRLLPDKPPASLFLNLV